MKTEILISFEEDRLEDYSSDFLATLWRVSQWNPAPSTDKRAGEIADKIAREIVKRWLARTPPELWRHKGSDHYWGILANHGHWEGDSWKPGTPAISLK